MIGRVIDISRDFRKAAFRITIETAEAPAGDVLDEWLGAAAVDVKITKHKERRSRDANAYFWTLCGKLSAAIEKPPRDIYRELIKDVGDNYDIVCVKNEAATKLRDAWETRGIGWTTDTTDSKIKGCQNVVLYYGSSTYDTAQMKRLIDLIVTECKAQGIETATPEEEALLIEKWGY